MNEINLCKAGYKLLIIIYSAMFLPIIGFLIVVGILEATPGPFISLAIFSVIYAVCIFIMRHCYLHEKSNMKTDGDLLEISRPDLPGPLIIKREEIVTLEYYKVTSFISWFAMVQGQCPKALFISYHKDGTIIRDAIGQVEYKEIKAFCEKYNFPLKMH